MVKLIVLQFVFVMVGVFAASTEGNVGSASSKAPPKHDFVLSDFNKQFFWQKPPEGMFEVNIGLGGSSQGQSAPIDLNGQQLMQFADINADMFTDIITVDKTRQSIVIHLFDGASSNYTQKCTFKVNDCKLITNVAVGRGDKTLRLFITCQDSQKKTILKMYDRNMNGELTPDKRILSKDDQQTDTGDIEAQSKKIIEKIVHENHMVFKTEGIVKSLVFEEVTQILYLTKDSQPFVGDINGDFYDDIIFNNFDTANSPGGALNVAIFNPKLNKYDIGNFKDKMVDPDCGGFKSPLSGAAELTTPHSVSMIDFDGDCLSDLFITVQDPANPKKKYYEIYLRREQVQSRDTLQRPNTNGRNSLCLAQFDDISNIQNNQIFDFADIDRDGMIDMLFITDKKSMNFIVNYNMLKSPSEIQSERRSQRHSTIASKVDSITDQIQLNRASICAPGNRPIQKMQKIFAPYQVDVNGGSETADSSVFEDKTHASNDQSKYVFNQLLSSQPGAKEIYQDVNSAQNFLLPRLHIGDINSDGYPDILVTIQYNNGSSIPYVLLNQEMPKPQSPTTGLSDADFHKIDGETQDQKQIKNRYFNLNVTATKYHSVLNKYQNARFAIFTDMIENSMLDFIVVSEPDDTTVPTISPIYNNLQGDTFFIKARMLTDDTVGSPVRGASIKAVLTNLSDQKFVVSGCDAGQSAYGSLSIPNIVIGVGRSNNFVEMFTVSSYQNGTRSVREWSPIIPKSVLYIYSNMEKDSSWWQLSLLVNPTHKVNMILIVDAMLLLVIGLIIIILYLQEKVQDSKEQVDAFNYF